MLPPIDLPQVSHRKTFEKISAFTASTAIGTGVMVLVGWQWDIEFFKSIFPNRVAMNPLTALVFISGGTAVFLSAEQRDKTAHFLACLLGGFIFLVGALKVSSFLNLSNFALDKVLFAEKLGSNQIAPNTAFSALMLGLAIMLTPIRSPRIERIWESCLLGIILIGVLALLGYVYDFQALYKVSSYIPMAIHTAFCYLTLSVGVYFLKPETGYLGFLTAPNMGGLLARRIFPATILVPALLGGFRLAAEKKGILGTELGLAMMVTGTILIFNVLVWWAGGHINRIDKIRKEAEMKLQEMNEDLEVRVQRRTEELRETQKLLVKQERLRALGEMASGIAHDFNNALSPILGYSELILENESALQESHAGYLKIINTSARDAAGIVNRLRQFGRAREANEKFLPVNLKTLIEQTVLLTQPKWKTQAISKGVEINVSMDLKDISHIDGSEQQLREVLTNLIFNAVDAMNQNGSIVVRVYDENDQVVLEVTDTGIGMTDEIRQKCLEPFFTTKGDQGTGLGLSMVYGIIQRHSGHMDVQSVLGQGTTFKIQFPAIKNGAQSSPQKTAEKKRRSLSVLYVEDNAQVRTVMAGYLKNEGCHVEEAQDGAEGLQKFYVSKDRYDLVIVDRNMPRMGGHQLAFAIRKLVPEQKIIMLSGTAVDGEESTEHIDILLSKPITIEALRQALAHMFA